MKFDDSQSRFVSKEIDEQFRSIIYQIIHNRETGEKIKKDDLLQVIFDLREKLGKDVITDGIIAGHSMTFLVPETFRNRFLKLLMEYSIFCRVKAMKHHQRQCRTPSTNSL